MLRLCQHACHCVYSIQCPLKAPAADRSAVGAVVYLQPRLQSEKGSGRVQRKNSPLKMQSLQCCEMIHLTGSNHIRVKVAFLRILFIDTYVLDTETATARRVDYTVSGTPGFANTLKCHELVVAKGDTFEFFSLTAKLTNGRGTPSAGFIKLF